MNFRIFIALFLLLVITSCRSKSAFNYNQAIVQIEKSIEADIVGAEDKLSYYLTNDIYDSALVITQRMEDLVDSKIKEVEMLETPKVKEADNFRAATLRYFSYIKSIYTAYKDYILQASEEDREQARTRLLAVVDNKEKAVYEMQQAQQKYAQANGFGIDK